MGIFYIVLICCSYRHNCIFKCLRFCPKGQAIFALRTGPLHFIIVRGAFNTPENCIPVKGERKMRGSSSLKVEKKTKIVSIQNVYYIWP